MIKKTGRKEVDLGTCQFCGEALKEIRSGWGCLNSSCGAIIFKDDRFFNKVLNMKITRNYACKLLMGDELKLRQVDIKGEKHDVSLTWGFTDDPRFKYGYKMKFLDRDEKKVEKKDGPVTGFDILNGE